MNSLKLMLILAVVGFAAAVNAEMTELSCTDFQPTPEALARFADLKGACEGVVDRDGELYVKFTAIVRRASGSNLTLYLPATDHTFRVQPEASHRVLLGNRKSRARDLTRGQEIHIYLAVSQFARPAIEEVAFVTETNLIVDLEIDRVAALPTTASPWPTAASAGFILLGVGWLLRRRRFRRQSL